jgi:hypothetical protein
VIGGGVHWLEDIFECAVVLNRGDIRFFLVHESLLLNFLGAGILYTHYRRDLFKGMRCG